MPRLFVALGLPEPFREAVKALQSGLQGVRWLPADSLHLTLAFIGEVDDGAARRVETALNEVTAAAFSMALHGVGRFPERGAPRILWTGASPKNELAALAEGVRRALRSADLIPDRRRFLPHVTIGRLRKRPAKADLKRYLDAFSPFRTDPAGIESFHLFSSTLTASGARYLIEKSYRLKGAAAPGLHGTNFQGIDLG